MKNWYVILIFILAVSCLSDDKMTEIEETPDMEMKMGEEETKDNFVSGAHETSGTASVNDDESILKFTDFKTDIGPLLEFYLSTDKEAMEYIRLGVLKGIEADYQYDILLVQI